MRRAIATLALIATMGAAWVATAQTPADAARARAAAQDAAARARRFEAVARTARTDAMRTEALASAVAARIQSAEAAIALADTRIAAIARASAAQTQRLATIEAPAIRLAAALQLLARRPPAIDLVQPGTLRDAAHTRAVLASIRPVIDARAGTMRAEVARVRSLRAAADRARATMAAARATLATERDRLAMLAAARRAAGAGAASSALIEQDRAIALGEEARDLDALVATLDRQADRRALLAALPGPVLRPAAPGAPRAAPDDGARTDGAQAPYRLPVMGRVVTGMGAIGADGVRARGLTIETLPGALVTAPTGGRIAFAGRYRAFGMIVIIDHGRGWTTLLTNLDTLDVRVGDSVGPGAPIGRVPDSGPARLTVELRRSGTPVDIARLVG